MKLTQGWIALGVPAALLAMAPVVNAQQPDAGRVLEQLKERPSVPPPKPPSTRIEERPEAKIPEGMRINVRRVRVSGNSIFPESDLLPLVKDGEGRSLSLVELNELAARITRHYRDQGYVVARAYLPAQDVSEGTVEFAVLEGKLGTVEIKNAAGLADSALAPLTRLRPGEVLQMGQLESSLLTLSDVPGVDVRTTLRPGTAVGASDLLVEVAPGSAVTGSVDVDNYGSRFTGANRLGANLNINNPFNLGDQIGIGLQTSSGGLAYGRLSYQLPVGAAGTRVGAAYSSMHYRLGKNFAALDADGDADVASLYLTHPLIRSRVASVYGQLQYDDKKLEDRVGTTATRTNKAMQNLSLGLFGNVLDGFAGGGASGFNLNHTLGRLQLDPVTAALDAATARAQGGFGSTNLSLQRTQRLADAWLFYVSYTGHWGSKNLDSSEKISLGGPFAVRAYPQGESAGDIGRVITAELRWLVSQSWQAQLFYDDGHVKTNKSPWVAGANQRDLSGYGVGVSYFSESGWSLRSFIAWRGAAQPTSDVDRKPRIWAQLRYVF